MHVTNPDTGTLYDVNGVDNPFTGLSWGFGPDSAGNQDHSASFLATSGPPAVVHVPAVHKLGVGRI